ncbi:MAG: type IV secretion system DNA-binding domain-containing protein [Steroidobacteraceae bacterium]
MMSTVLTQGWSGLAISYAAVQGPMLAGLARGRAKWHKFLLSPAIAAPLTVTVGVGMAMATPLMAGIGVAQPGVIPFAVAASLSAAIGYAGGRAMSRGPSDGKTHQRGAMVAEQPRYASGHRQGDTPTAEITLARRPVAARDETKHFKLIGTTGTGKSTAIQEILNGALARGDRAVIADPDGGYLRQFHDGARGDTILNPFDGRSVKWDLFSEIRNAYDVDQLARSLIPDHDGADRSWRGYARTFFSSVTRQMHEAGETDMSELYRLLVAAEVKELRTLVRGTAAQPFLDEHNSRMFDSIRSVTSSAVGAIDYIVQQKAQGFSIRQWVSEERPGVLFIPYKAGQIAALGSTISAWMRLAIFEAMDREEQSTEYSTHKSGRLWFVIDELDALGPIDGLKDALARLRKFNGRCVLGFQSIAQVSSTYGHGDAHTIIENCGNTLILRCSASEGGGTARFASQLIGDREVLRTSVSRSRRLTELGGSISHSDHFHVESAILPAQIEQLPDLAGYLKRASDPQWERVCLDAKRAWNQRQATHSQAAAAGTSEMVRGRATMRDGDARE